MSQKNLNEFTNALIKELHATEKLDEKTRQSLVALANEINQNVQDSDHSSIESHQKTLEEQALEFKDQHPQISSIIEQIIQSLSNIGI